MRLCVQQGRRIHGGPEGRIEGNGAPQPPEDAVAQRIRGEARPADLDDRAGQVLQNGSLFHDLPQATMDPSYARG